MTNNFPEKTTMTIIARKPTNFFSQKLGTHYKVPVTTELDYYMNFNDSGKNGTVH